MRNTFGKLQRSKGKMSQHMRILRHIERRQTLRGKKKLIEWLQKKKLLKAKVKCKLCKKKMKMKEHDNVDGHQWQCRRKTHRGKTVRTSVRSGSLFERSKSSLFNWMKYIYSTIFMGPSPHLDPPPPPPPHATPLLPVDCEDKGLDSTVSYSGLSSNTALNSINVCQPHTMASVLRQQPLMKAHYSTDNVVKVEGSSGQSNPIKASRTHNELHKELLLAHRSVTSGPPPSDWHEIEMSGMDTAAVTVVPSLAGSLSSVDEQDDVCTASWVCEQSSIDESTCPDSSPPSSEATSLASDDPTTTVGSPPSPAYSGPPLASNIESQLTSWFGSH
ncbi:hypothetical protein ABVT39_002146 [Epinephelus coioides]